MFKCARHVYSLPLTFVQANALVFYNVVVVESLQNVDLTGQVVALLFAALGL